MLDCGSNNSFDELDKIVKDTGKSVKILDKIVTYDKEKAEKTLERIGLNKEQVQNVIQYTHCEAPENFFITSEDMVGKAGVWSHFGSWDFHKSEMYSKVKGLSLEEGKKILSDEKFNLTEEQIEKYYFEIQSEDGNQWIAPWPGYITGIVGCDAPNAEKGTVTCVHNVNGQRLPFLVDLTKKDIVLEGAREEIRPNTAVFLTEEGTEEKVFDGATVGVSIILIPKEGGFNSMLVHPVLANSIFTRLFFLEGHGLKYFDKFDDRRGVTGGRIIVWKVDWEGNDKNKPYSQTAQPIQNESDPEVEELAKDIDGSIEELEELEGMNTELNEEALEEELIE